MDSKPVYGYKLHKRFAPYFGFSYRGAYEPVTIPEYILLDMFEKPFIPANEWVSILRAKTSDNEDAQLLLPFLRSELDD